MATTGAEARVAAGFLELPPAALASALVDPRMRLLVGDTGAALLRRQWGEDGAAEAVLLCRTGVRLGSPAVVGVAVDWGCDRVRDAPAARTAPVPPPADDVPLPDRFRHLAALAATRVEVAIALARDGGEGTIKADGSPALAADEAAHLAAAAVLRRLGVTVLSEERVDRQVADEEPWVVLDPLDGTGNFRAGLAPWAFSAGLVHRGRAVAGVVVDLSSGRRWSGTVGAGAERDGVPVRPRAGSTLVVPTAPSGSAVAVPRPVRRIRVTGCTAVDVCLVADGAAAAWHNLDRSGTHVHDVAAGLALLAAGGGVALTPDGDPLELRPDTEELIRFVAAGDPRTAEDLRAEFAPSARAVTPPDLRGARPG